MKRIVATIDRIEKRLMPHTPCPLVHPLPIFVPIPTNTPPKIIKGIEDVTSNCIEFFENILNIKGPATNPRINNIFIPRFNDLKITLLAIPLTPASLPVEIKKMITAKPIITPPIKELNGVKFIKSILIIYLTLSYNLIKNVLICYKI